MGHPVHEQLSGVHGVIKFFVLFYNATLPSSALLHDFIAEYSIDVLAICESWMTPAAHDAIAHDAAPDGYHIVHLPRADGRRGGGLAVIYRCWFHVASLRISAATTSFDVQALQLTIAAGKTFTIVAAVTSAM